MQCKHLPLLKIDPDNIIPDELLTENLISVTKTNDRMHNKRIKLLEGPIVTAVIESIRSCHISFDVWETDGAFECTSLMGTDKKKLLKGLLPKLIYYQPASFAHQVKKLWEVC